MAKSMSIPEFVRQGWQEERTIDTVIAHLERHKIAYRIIGTTVVIFAGLSESAFASTGIDAGANQLYKKLLNIAKWVIVFKGGMDTVKDVTEGDMHGARKHFLGYLVTYAILWALPWGMGEVDKMFTDMEASGT